MGADSPMRDTIDRGVDLLAFLEAAVVADGGVPGINGRVSIGVATPTGPRWLNAELNGGKAQVTREVRPLLGPDAVLILGGTEARRVLMGEPPLKDAIMDAGGDVRLLDRFFERYLGSKSVVGLRAQRGEDSEPRRRRRRRS